MLNREDFIQKSIQLHGDRYDYSQVLFINTYTKVDIVCKKHGLFKQTPKSHLTPSNCLKCSIEITQNKNRKTTEQFIEQAKAIHGEKYDYKEAVYERDKGKVNIICKTHGNFLQTAHAHLKGHGEFLQKPNEHINSRSGCGKCSGKILKSQDEVIKNFKKVHNDSYIYDDFVYINDTTKSKIICKKHGDFMQRPKQHRRGEGCPKCGNHREDYTTLGFFCTKRAERHKEEWLKIKAIVYFIKIHLTEDEFCYKIGITRNTINKRYHGNKFLKIDKINEIQTNLYTACYIESNFIKDNIQYRYRSDNKFDGHTECFSPDIINKN